MPTLGKGKVGDSSKGGVSAEEDPEEVEKSKAEDEKKLEAWREKHAPGSSAAMRNMMAQVISKTKTS